MSFKVQTLIKHQVPIPGNPELFVWKIPTLDREDESLIIVVVVPETNIAVKEFPSRQFLHLPKIEHDVSYGEVL